jgi:chloramphenicol-sensitive protein RarD
MSTAAEGSPRRHTAMSGVAIAALAFVQWGLYPFYFKALSPVGAFEIVAHRIVWSTLFLACLLPLCAIRAAWPSWS